MDGMVPLSKFTVGSSIFPYFLHQFLALTRIFFIQSGKTGKSVSRSYLSTLDLMVPVEASISGAIGSSKPQTVPDDQLTVSQQQLKTVKDRYTKAMEYLKSPDDAPGANGKSKLQTYVEKQALWSEAVEKYSAAQDRALTSFKPTGPGAKENVKESRELFMQWIQEHGRDVGSRSHSGSGDVRIRISS